ncbi:MAG: cupin domain-containing protein [Candidatus Kapabacteria bacterium]|nr:cupin domain-containing protein [Candidatus Kapabacteria bacterium]
MNIIDRLNLLEHPEGGYYREYYRSSITVPTERGPRCAATSIWFCLPVGVVSNFHRLSNDEIWYWHEGGPVVVHIIHPDGRYEHVELGSPPFMHAAVLPAGTWFGAESLEQDVLVSAMVAPGFEFEDFELATRAGLLAMYPQHGEIIQRLTREEGQRY